jgi:tol-pal system protein YbgF
MRQLGVVLLVSLVSACAVSPEEDPVQIKLRELDGRVQRIERANQSVVDMAQKLEAANADVRRLRGRIEELENSNEAVKRQQRELYSDLEKRIAALSAGGVAGGVSGATGAGAAAEQAAYTQAFDALKASNYPAAVSGFSSFLSAYPSSPLAENAQYWLGEAHYAKGEYEQAATAFRVVGERWPTSRKAPDALLKLGYSQIELKQVGQARVTLSDVTRKFPDSDASRLATERLSKLPGR